MGFVLRHILFQGGHRHGPRGLDDAAGIDKHVFDGRAHGVGIDADVLVHQVLGYAEGFLAHQFHRRAIRKQTHIAQGHAFARCHRLQHGVGVVHLHTNHLDVGAHRLDVIGHAADEAAAANRHEHGVQRALVLPEHFHGDRALARNHLGVVKRVDEAQALLVAQLHRVGVGIGIAVAVQHHLATQRLHRVDFQSGCGDRHDDDGACAQLASAQRHALRMVASRRTNDAFVQLRGAQLRHLVVGPTQLEAEHRLLVFPLQQHLVFQALAEDGRDIQIGFLGHVIDLGGEDFLQVVGGFQVHFAGRAGGRGGHGGLGG